MVPILRSTWHLLRETGQAYVSRGGPLLGAALAFYTILSVAPLLLVILACTSWTLSHTPLPLAQEGWESSFDVPIDAQTGAWLHSLLDNLRQTQAQAGAGIIGTLLVWYSGTRLFVQLQQALNQLWQLQVVSSGVRAGVFATLQDQAAAVMMVFIATGSLTLAVASSTALGAVRGAVGFDLPGSDWLWSAGGLTLNLAILGTLFALLLRILPAARLAARDLAIGASATALLFGLLEYPLSYYLGYQGIESAFGAAGSLVVFLLWVYYSAQIFLLGAQFTQQYAVTFGRGLVLERNAQLMVSSNAAQAASRPPIGVIAAGTEAVHAGAAIVPPPNIETEAPAPKTSKP